jgi:hypothetical protein
MKCVLRVVIQASTSNRSVRTMGDVVANMSMALDGYIEDSHGGVDAVFSWLYRVQTRA